MRDDEFLEHLRDDASNDRDDLVLAQDVLDRSGYESHRLGRSLEKGDPSRPARIADYVQAALADGARCAVRSRTWDAFGRITGVQLLVAEPAGTRAEITTYRGVMRHWVNGNTKKRHWVISDWEPAACDDANIRLVQHALERRPIVLGADENELQTTVERAEAKLLREQARANGGNQIQGYLAEAEVYAERAGDDGPVGLFAATEMAWALCNAGTLMGIRGEEGYEPDQLAIRALEALVRGMESPWPDVRKRAADGVRGMRLLMLDADIPAFAKRRRDAILAGAAGSLHETVPGNEKRWTLPRAPEVSEFLFTDDNTEPDATSGLESDASDRDQNEGGHRAEWSPGIRHLEQQTKEVMERAEVNLVREYAAEARAKAGAGQVSGHLAAANRWGEWAHWTEGSIAVAAATEMAYSVLRAAQAAGIKPAVGEPPDEVALTARDGFIRGMSSRWGDVQLRAAQGVLLLHTIMDVNAIPEPVMVASRRIIERSEKSLG